MEDPRGPRFRAKLLAESRGLGEYLGDACLADKSAEGHGAIEEIALFQSLSSGRQNDQDHCVAVTIGCGQGPDGEYDFFGSVICHYGMP